MNPFQVVKDFESALCDYTGAPYCVTTTSCTMAILLACAWEKQKPPLRQTTVVIPDRTYVGVPMSIKHAGFGVDFMNIIWRGSYKLAPLHIWDSARHLCYNMWEELYDGGSLVCLSFHPTKHLGISTHGGAILHDNPEADEWLRMARFDGRKEGVPPAEQKDWIMGFHCYMNPVTAAEGLQRLSNLPKHNDPLPNDDYPDLSKLEIFR